MADNRQFKKDMDLETPVSAGEGQAQLRRALESANDVCRSAMEIVQRRGERTNWEGFEKRLGRSLELQHKVMYPATPPAPDLREALRLVKQAQGEIVDRAAVVAHCTLDEVVIILRATLAGKDKA